MQERLATHISLKTQCICVAVWGLQRVAMVSWQRFTSASAGTCQETTVTSRANFVVALAISEREELAWGSTRPDLPIYIEWYVFASRSRGLQPIISYRCHLFDGSDTFQTPDLRDGFNKQRHAGSTLK